MTVRWQESGEIAIAPSGQAIVKFIGEALTCLSVGILYDDDHSAVDAQP